MMVSILNRISINLEWIVRILMNIERMVIRMKPMMVRTSYHNCHLESQDKYCRSDFNLHIVMLSKVSPTWDALRSCSD